MQEQLKPILEIQEYDMKMIRLSRVKKERQTELKQIEDLRRDLKGQFEEKDKEIVTLNEDIEGQEKKIEEINAKYKKLEEQQSAVKKVDEFNALTQEMTQTERERIAVEQKVSDLVDKRTGEEELLTKIKESFVTSEESSLALEKEIRDSIRLINEEGQKLKKERDKLAQTANPEILRLYERLLVNKKDRVVVAIENRTCSGCHIALTAQHENLVRKGTHLVFCEHCSRIHHWPEEREEVEGAAPRRRRRRPASA